MAAMYRLRKQVPAFQWDGTVDGAYELFDFVGDAECQIQDDASLLIRGEDDWVKVEPGEWIVRQGLGQYAVMTDERFWRNFEEVER